ncbi:hypothetical protein IFM89_018637 [Coptis chinensis]|uniref:Uncharacterized protein n=1 Tax=Coptis chinensis TaxID=261450 RepID=A0A835H466_9MAGN|nr:hypothetical protein IFM89_018637 [Coptis chinensis]
MLEVGNDDVCVDPTGVGKISLILGSAYYYVYAGTFGAEDSVFVSLSILINSYFDFLFLYGATKDSVEHTDNKGNGCDHSFVLKEDLGYVCRFCGVINKCIETIFDFQWGKVCAYSRFCIRLNIWFIRTHGPKYLIPKLE